MAKNEQARHHIDNLEIPGFDTPVIRKRKQGGRTGNRRFYYKVTIDGPWEEEWANHALKKIPGAREPKLR